MKLNQAIAQKIVQRAMQIIPNSVNVMNDEGIIIASGDPSRLNQRHIGAIMALRHNKLIEITDELAQQWNYEARAGINVPIMYGGQNIGVVGVSGELESVRQYAELVKMAAELIVEQVAVLEKERWERRYKEEFVLQLVKQGLDTSQIGQQAVFFGLKILKSYVVVIIKLMRATQDNLHQLLAHLEQNHPSLATAVIDLDKIILLHPIEQHNEFKPKALSRYLPNSMANTDYRIVIGHKVANLHELPFSYQTALHCLQYIELIHSKKQTISFDDFRVPALLSDFLKSWQGKEMISPLSSLWKQDEKGILRKTLQQYFLSNCDLAQTSEKLFIHPNTLRYRLDKIEHITSLSFNKIEDKFTLYLGSLSAN
ncbi:hypothetical protein A1D22_07475 [Pasteurellaceae bacterium LFhippo2]|nr:hypothetical protein [Pasteurellaceae bacterium LFhippo2]